MVPPINLKDMRFGRLVAVVKVGRRGSSAVWRLRCDCGTSIDRPTASLRQGHVTSCGCLRSEATRDRSTLHGHRIGGKTTPTKLAYERAKSLCFTPSAHGYKKVGGEGIGMCEEWKDSFQAFLRDMGERPTGFTLGRKDPEKDFSPENCEWIPSLRGNGRAR
jgi:hypothetical protein